MVFTTRLSGGKGGRNGLEHELRRLGIKQENSKPNHPQTQGKVERFQQTMKNWLRAQPRQLATLAELQSLLDAFASIYSTRRTHAHWKAAQPRPLPTSPGPRPSPAAAPPTPTTASAPTASTTPASSPCATRGSSATSESDAPTPERYQPTGKPSGWPKKTPRPLCEFAVSSMSCDITLERMTGIEPA
jgi:hypothetical protein